MHQKGQTANGKASKTIKSGSIVGDLSTSLPKNWPSDLLLSKVIITNKTNLTIFIYL